MNLQIIGTSLLAFFLVGCTDAVDDKPVNVEEDDAAYFVFNYHIDNREAYDSYLAQVPTTLEQYGVEIVVADFDSEIVEGDAGHVTVVLKFASNDAAMKWYQSPEYQAIIELRTKNSAGIATLASPADD